MTENQEPQQEDPEATEFGDDGAGPDPNAERERPPSEEGERPPDPEAPEQPENEGGERQPESEGGEQ